MTDDYLNPQFLERWFRGELPEPEREEFEEWLRDHPGERREIERFLTLYRAAGRLQPSAEPDSKRIWNGIRSRIAPPVRISYLSYVKYAAAAVLLLAATLLVLRLTADHTVTIQAEEGEQRTWILPDSSRVILNAASSITYDEAEWPEERLISLTGEAFFDVREGSPFHVTTRRSRTEVLGTRFNVRSREEVERVVCQSGEVQVTSLYGSGSVLLEAMQAALILEGGVEVSSRTDLASEIGWIEGQFRFEDEPLYRVIRSMERQFDVEIRYADRFEGERFTGSYTNDDLENALQIISAVLGAEYRHVDNGTVEIY